MKPSSAVPRQTAAACKLDQQLLVRGTGVWRWGQQGVVAARQVRPCTRGGGWAVELLATHGSLV